MELNKKRGMAMKKIKISYLLLGTNIILNLFLINKTMELSNYINSNSSLIPEIKNELNSLENKIDSLPSEISKKASFVSSLDISLLSSIFTDDTYTLSFNVYFKELQNGEIPYIIYADEENPSNWTKISLNENSTLCYSADLSFNYSKNYQYRIITEGTNSRANEIEHIISTDYYPLKAEVFDQRIDSSDDSASIGINIFNTYELSDFQPVRVWVEIDGYDKEFLADIALNKNSTSSNESHYTVSISPKDIPSDFRGSLPLTLYVTCKNGSTLSFKNICRTVVIY